jgi:hypothetical protein
MKLPRVEASIIELAIVMIACVVPMFVLANELSGDEIVKGSAGLALASMTAGILGGYKIWKSKNGG